MKNILYSILISFAFSNSFSQSKVAADVIIMAEDAHTSVELALLVNDLIYNAKEILIEVDGMKAKLKLIQMYIVTQKNKKYFNVNNQASLRDKIKMYTVQIDFVGRGLKELLRLIRTTLKKHTKIIAQKVLLKSTDKALSISESLSEKTKALGGSISFSGTKRKIATASSTSEFRIKAEQAKSVLESANSKILTWFKTMERLNKDVDVFVQEFQSSITIASVFRMGNYVNKRIQSNQDTKIKSNIEYLKKQNERLKKLKVTHDDLEKYIKDNGD